MTLGAKGQGWSPRGRVNAGLPPKARQSLWELSLWELAGAFISH